MDPEANLKEEYKRIKEHEVPWHGLSERVVRLEKEVQQMNTEIGVVRDLLKEILRQQEFSAR